VLYAASGVTHTVGFMVGEVNHSAHDHIEVSNARVNSLKNVSLRIPRNQMVVFTGVSGSGKSSLVFDTLHTEAQRQLIETFGSFARRRLPKLSRPDVDEITNLSTSIVIDQKRLGRNLRSTVGTATEVYTYLRMLFARCGDVPGIPSFLLGFNHPDGMCPACAGLGKRIRIDIDLLIDPTLSIRQGAITHPDWKVGGWNWREITAVDVFDVDVPVGEFSDEELDRLLYAESVAITKAHGTGTYAKTWQGVARKLERLYLDKAEDELSEARRNAYQRFFSYGDCETCGGLRLNERALSVRAGGIGVGDAVQMELTDLDAWLATFDDPVSDPLVDKMRSILSHLIDIGVGYLSLNRSVSTLSGGESQRVKMSRQLDCDLIGMMYILDEPSVGLHPRDIDKLIALLRQLRDKGNSVLVVEHDEAVISAADHVVEIGPGPGTSGGKVCFNGPIEEFLPSDCQTATMIRTVKTATARERRGHDAVWKIRGAAANNLKNVDVDIPQRVLVAVTGVAGSGKSTLINDVLIPQQHDAIVVDQTAVGRSRRSNPATYLGFFDNIRKVFAEATGKPAAMFSFNSSGACPTCKGQGHLTVEMSFLDDVRMDCSGCDGTRYRDEVLALTWHDLNIHDVLAMTARQALDVFEQLPIHTQLQMLCDVGLDYLTLGQPLSTLSGGECQRVKLAKELGKTGNLYVLDEPTTGLHMADIERLMSILDRFVDSGNSVVVIEHNLDVISQADWVIDLGPEGGNAGGELIASGTPEHIAAQAHSYTGGFLRSRTHHAEST